MGVQHLEVRGNYNLAISQINGEFDTEDPKMIAYKNVVLAISSRFKGPQFHHIPRDSNQAADVLARVGTKRDPVLENMFLERLFKPFVAWQDENIVWAPLNSVKVNSPATEEDKGIIGVLGDATS